MPPQSDIPMMVRSAGPSDVMRVNRTFVQMLGLDAAELQGRPLLDWIHPEDRESIVRAVVGALLRRVSTAARSCG